LGLLFYQITEWPPTIRSYERYLTVLSSEKSRDSALSNLGSAYHHLGEYPKAIDYFMRVLDTGGGHELFYSPKAEWLDILQAWAERRQQ
jgi:tetratricopeptide (TPR) repeat protein